MPSFHRTARRRLPLAMLAGAIALLVAACGDTTPPPTTTTEPSITSFTATPATIAAGESSTLAWTVTGTTPTIVITNEANDTIHDTSEASGSHVVSPTGTTTYTLTATNAAGSDTATATVTILVPGEDPASITDLQAPLARGSQVALAWTAANATSFDVYGAASADPGAPADLIATLPGTARDTLVAIPTSDRQTIRVCARSTGGDTCATRELANVVVRGDDYDPYFFGGRTPDVPVPGTLRYVLAVAASGSIVGFASDVGAIDVFGVAVYYIEPVDPDDIQPGEGWQDAHLVFEEDVILSGPAATPVAITARSGWQAGDLGDAFTYRSRAAYVVAGANVELENLTVAGGAFIFRGGGIRNDGDLTLRSVEVSGNRAWEVGGGILNNPTGNLTIIDSVVRNNRAVTEDDEVDVEFPIRGGFPITVTNGGYGGGLYNAPGGVVVIENSFFEGNEAKISGGGIYNRGSATIDGTPVRDNVADHTAYAPVGLPLSLGGGIYSEGVLNFADEDLLDNLAHDAGGGLFMWPGSVTALTNVFVDGNAANEGGGIRREYYEGEEADYTDINVTYGFNAGGNYSESLVSPPAPTAVDGTTPAAQPGRHLDAPLRPGQQR